MKDADVLSIWQFIRQARGNTKGFLGDLFQREGDLVTIKGIFRNVHIFLNPACIEHILFTQREHYKKSPSPIVADKFAGILSAYNLVGTDNTSIWTIDRTALNPYFSESYIENYLPALIKTGKTQLSAWENNVTQKKPINIDYAFSALTFENAMATIFGGIQLDFDSAHHALRKALRLVQHYMFVCFALMGIVPKFLLWRHQALTRKIRRILSETVEKSLSPAADEHNVIKVLYEANKERESPEILQKHLCADAMTFLVAGHETLSTLLCWVFTYCSLFPGAAEKIYTEIETVVGQRDPTASDIKKLTYTRAFLQETLRLQPSFGAFFRCAAQDDTIGSHQIKRGDFLLISPLFMHRQKYWENPEGFSPERFFAPLPEPCQFTYMPFGAGPRSCIGQHFAMFSAIVIVVLIVQRFRLTLLPGFTMTREETLPMGKLRIDTEMMVHFAPPA